MDWGDLWNMHDVVTPQKARQLGQMVAAMVEASLAKVVEDAVSTNMHAFHVGLNEGMAGSELSMEFPDDGSPIAMGDESPLVGSHSHEGESLKANENALANWRKYDPAKAQGQRAVVRLSGQGPLRGDIRNAHIVHRKTSAGGNWPAQMTNVPCLAMRIR